MKKRSPFLSFFLFTSLLLCISAKLTVLSPQSVATKFDRQTGLDFRVLQYGQAHFGAHFVGNLVLSQPMDACGPLESFVKGEGTGRENLIAVAYSGFCQDFHKIRNAQQAGAQMLLVINEKDELPEEHGNRQGYQDSFMPVVLISRREGEILLEYMNEQVIQAHSGVNKATSESILISVNFPSDLRKEIVNLDFWLSAGEKQKITFESLSNLKKIKEKFGDSLFFTPHYMTWTCEACKLQGYSKADNPDCISGGRYCNPDPDDSGPMTGRDIVLENLRQTCIWKISKELWWVYVMKFEERCGKAKDVRHCGTELLSELAQEHWTNPIYECIDSSFIKKSGIVNEDLDDNELLQQEKAIQRELDVTRVPQLYINNKPYLGKISEINKVYEEICKELQIDNEVCKEMKKREGNMKDVWIVIGLIFLLGLVVLGCYRRIAKREYKQMTMEANNLVSNYFAMEDKEELEEK